MLTPMTRLASIACLSFLAACGGTSPAALVDASADANADASTDAGTDASDASTDAATPRYAMPSCDAPAFVGSPLGTRCGHFVDAEGRVRFLLGVNARVEGLFDVSFDDGRLPLEPIPSFDGSDAARMHELGFGVLRLPLNWSGLEPEDHDPPAYDAAYLDRIAEVVALCRDAGVLVLLDLHQDAYSKEIGEDGAPYWAIAPTPSARLGGPLDDLGARRQSADVLAASASFFGDAEPGPTLRARFSAMVSALTQRFLGDEGVLGIEVYNEPVANDAEVARLNEQVAAAIRAVDATRLVFFEPPVLPRNFTDQSARPDAPFPTPGAVYAPHVYTLAFFGSDAQREGMSLEGLRKGNRTARSEAEGFGTPLFVGEFGYDPAGIRAADWYAFERDLQDEYLASGAVWVWKERSQGSWGLFDYDEGTGTWSERPSAVAMVSRPRVVAVAGWPESYRVLDGKIDLTFAGDPEVLGPNLMYIPAGWDVLARCDGATVDVGTASATGFREVVCGGAGTHRLEVGPSAP